MWRQLCRCLTGWPANSHRRGTALSWIPAIVRSMNCTHNCSCSVTKSACSARQWLGWTISRPLWRFISSMGLIGIAAATGKSLTISLMIPMFDCSCMFFTEWFGCISSWGLSHGKEVTRRIYHRNNKGHAPSQGFMIYQQLNLNSKKLRLREKSKKGREVGPIYCQLRNS